MDRHFSNMLIGHIFESKNELKMHSGSNFKSHKTKTKAKVRILTSQKFAYYVMLSSSSTIFRISQQMAEEINFEIA